ncbi:hypothetical protein ACFXPX_13700 [Kitasatospora sp. NPDC059146]|uniref:hypothetical protein n=1 Tax=Kitasatospora sp. NPDC059146 TaxID=3346741 RepID=UPI0036C7BE6C
MTTETHPGTAPAEAAPPTTAPVQLTKAPGPAADTDPQTTGTAGMDDADGAEGEAKPKPNRLAAVKAATVGRTGEGAVLIGQWLAHWASTADQSGDEIRRRIVAAQLEAHTERRTEVEDAFRKETKRIVRLEEEASDGGLTQAQRGQLTFSREAARRLEKTLKDMRKAAFRPVQPTERQIARARSFGRLRRGGALIGAAGGAAAGVWNAPPAGLLGLLAATGLAWWTAAHPPRLTHRPVPAELLLPDLDPPTCTVGTDGTDGAVVAEGEEPDGASFPIAQAENAEQAAQCLRRALAAQQIDVASVTDVVRTTVGWSMTVTVASGDPADIDADRTSAEVRTLLKLPRNGLAVECWPDASDTATVRLQTRPGFTDMGPLAENTPLSHSIMDAGSFGQGLDGTELAFSLAGVMGFLVADSGGGKSSIMLALADWATSCRDAVVLSIDPRGEGVEALGDAIQLAVSDDKHVLKTLDWLDKLCQARTKLRKSLGYGKTWRPSPEHPAVIVFVDEWHDLPVKAKARLLRLLRIGRKEGVWIIGASQFGTVQDLGSAIAPKMSLKMAGCCRGIDVTGLFGQGALREGYRADRLKPGTHTDPADAGTVYIQGLPGQRNRPMSWKFRHLPDDEATRRGTARAKAGLPDLTASAALAGLDWPALLTALGARRPAPAPVGGSAGALRAASILDVIDAMNGEPTIHVGPLLERLAEADPDVYGKFTKADLEALLAPYGVTARQARAMTEDGEKNRTGYYLSDITDALTGPDDDEEEEGEDE